MSYVYLVLGILFVTAWALCYKIANQHRCELLAINMVLYVAGTAAMAIGTICLWPGFNRTAIWLGAVNGVSTYVATVAFFEHVKKSALAISWTLIALAIVFPVTVSILFWHEHPTTKQYAGLALIPVAIVLCGMKRKEPAKR